MHRYTAAPSVGDCHIRRSASYHGRTAQIDRFDASAIPHQASLSYRSLRPGSPSLAVMLDKHQSELIEHAMAVGALKFGSFTLKSGRYQSRYHIKPHPFLMHKNFTRISPYFFNAGLISSGSMLATLSAGYASLIHTALDSSDYAKFDVLFGPAYKGISLAACTAMVLHRDHGINVGFAYDRKEAKDHGEGGMMVGASVSGKKVLILDDVMTAGTATRNAVDMIRSGGGEVVGIVLCLDREEVGKEGGSTVKEMERYVGGPGRVKAILRMRDLMAWLEGRGRTEDLAAMKDYWNKYGVGDS